MFYSELEKHPNKLHHNVVWQLHCLRPECPPTGGE